MKISSHKLDSDKLLIATNVYYPRIDTLRLQDVNKFILSASVVSQFKTTWGDEYFDKASDIWAFSVDHFKNNKAINMPLEELIFCMEYDYVLGPSIGVPENKKIEFAEKLPAT